MQRYKQAYFGLLGAAVLCFGTLEVLTVVSGHRIDSSIVLFASGAFRGVWGGLVTVFAGVFMLRGLRDFGEVHQLAKLFIGCILLWIMAATDILALIAAAIPIPDDAHWLNTLPAFLHTLAPLYTPAILLLPFSLPIIACIKSFTQEKNAG